DTPYLRECLLDDRACRRRDVAGAGRPRLPLRSRLAPGVLIRPRDHVRANRRRAVLVDDLRERGHAPFLERAADDDLRPSLRIVQIRAAAQVRQQADADDARAVAAA